MAFHAVAKRYSSSVAPEARKAGTSRFDGEKADAWSLGVLGLLLLTGDWRLLDCADLHVLLGEGVITRDVIRGFVTANRRAQAEPGTRPRARTKLEWTVPPSREEEVMDVMEGLLHRDPAQRMSVTKARELLALQQY